MRILADANVGTIVVASLRSDGHDIAYVRELDKTADDEVILAWANDQQRIVLTNDLDFGEKVFRDQLPSFGVLLLRLGKRSGRQRVGFIRSALQKHADQMRGNMVVVSATDVRVRPIPSVKRGKP